MALPSNKERFLDPLPLSESKSVAGSAEFQIAKNQPSSIHRLSSPIFRCSIDSRHPVSVTPLLTSTLRCFGLPNPYIFCEDMILAPCHCHHILISNHDKTQKTRHIFMKRRGFNDIKSCCHIMIISSYRTKRPKGSVKTKL